MSEWLNTKPERPGVYAVRKFHLGFPRDFAIVEVDDYNGALCCNLHCVNSAHDQEDKWSPLADYSKSFEWKWIGVLP